LKRIRTKNVSLTARHLSDFSTIKSKKRIIPPFMGIGWRIDTPHLCSIKKMEE